MTPRASATETRVCALERVLTQKRYVDPAALDKRIDPCRSRIGLRNGTRVVARRWVSPDSAKPPT